MKINTSQKYGGMSLAASEVGLGSILHGLKIPFAGHLLSLNQALLLTLVAKNSAQKNSVISNVNSVSLFGAFAKSWSPAGKRLTPMLAIALQGLLYSLGLFFGGVNFLGVILACAISSVWSFIQPVLIAYFLFGKAFLESLWQGANTIALQFSISESWLFSSIVLLVLIKISATVFLGLCVWCSAFGEKKYRSVLAELKSRSPKKLIGIDNHKSIWVNSIHPLTNRWFALSLLVSIVFFALSGSYDASGVWKFILRPIVTLVTIGLLFEFIGRRFKIKERFIS